jgi:A/G-specific adenine glycosylase
VDENTYPIKQIDFFRKHIIKWERQHFANFPWRTTANSWHALVAEIMLQRTKAEQVLSTYIKFTSKYPSPLQYINDKHSNVFSSLGLEWREQLLKNLAISIIKDGIPNTKEGLLKLPGIGEYIASAYLSFHINKRAFIIDSNVVRLYGKFFGFNTNSETRRKKCFTELAEFMTPRKNYRLYNYGLIDITRTICKLKPSHNECPLRFECYYFNSSHF